MKTTTYKPLAIGATPTLGTSGAGVKALQTQYNQANPTATQLKVDGLYGPLTASALTATPPTMYNGQVTDYGKSIGYNPVSSSTNYGSQVTATGKQINDLGQKYGVDYDTSALRKSQENLSKYMTDTLSQYKSDYEADIMGIKSSYEGAAKTQGVRQNKDYAGRATGLITSGGGYLGTTQSQQGALQNLSDTHEQESQALMSKRDVALRAAKESFDGKQITMAMKQLSLAQDTEKEIYSRQKDFADQQLSIVRENRANDEYTRKFADDKVKAYSLLSKDEFDQLDPNQIAEGDKYFYPGYTAKARDINEVLAQGKSIENDIKLKSDLQSLINKTPAGQKIPLSNGQVYVGLKKAGGASKGGISFATATNLGVPSLASKDESDVILSLALANPPTWYREYYQRSNPELYKTITPEQLRNDWKLFTEQPDIEAYKNSAVVTKRIEQAKDDTYE